MADLAMTRFCLPDLPDSVCFSGPAASEFGLKEGAFRPQAVSAAGAFTALRNRVESALSGCRIFFINEQKCYDADKFGVRNGIWSGNTDFIYD